MSVALGIPRIRTRGRLEAPTDRAPDAGLTDRFGRRATDLRISLTDRCNLRCTYCMPAEGLDWLPKPQVMTADEIVRLATIAVRDLGVSSIRLTGGEPLLRAELIDIVRGIASIDSSIDLGMTTNAIGLAARASALREAGLHRLNVSLDTIDRNRYVQITRRDRLPQALAGIDAAVDAGFAHMKINAVVTPGEHELEVPDLVDWAIRRGFELRTIEHMPLGEHGWQRDSIVTAARIRELVRERFTLEPHPEHRGAAPAERFIVTAPDGTTGTIGIIASVTEPFCSACSRTRLTAEGTIRTCLFDDDEVDLLGIVRAGASDTDIANQWRFAMFGKWAGHRMREAGFTEPVRTMSRIGG